MPAQPFVDKLNAQIAYEYGAHQQYVANAVWFDAQTLPRLQLPEHHPRQALHLHDAHAS